MDSKSIRVNATTIKRFPGAVVMIIGIVTAVDKHSDTVTIDAGGEVVITTVEFNEMKLGKIYEIVGKCIDGMKIESYRCVELSDNLNLVLAQILADKVLQFKEMFI
ncbi:hypothetical protein JCM33374_g5055 [Metschnikowia sp. JCM 33374]|nr:hypothetical protein JCM33374_g5055 [Metschnikowia sp. JCM 33374]